MHSYAEIDGVPVAADESLLTSLLRDEWGFAGTVVGTEVVQLYLHDPVAQTTRPVVRLIAYRRVPLNPGEAARVTFTVPADLASFTGVDGRRVVEPGDVELRFGRSSTDIAATVPLRMTGPLREVGPGRRLEPGVQVDAIPASSAQSVAEAYS